MSEIENVLDDDNGENVDENIEEIELKIEPITEADLKFLYMFFIQSDVYKLSTD